MELMEGGEIFSKQSEQKFSSDEIKHLVRELLTAVQEL
jgi:serine/threonine protein kinase